MRSNTKRGGGKRYRRREKGSPIQGGGNGNRVVSKLTINVDYKYCISG